jgi:hypothetical protein
LRGGTRQKHRKNTKKNKALQNKQKKRKKRLACVCPCVHIQTQARHTQNKGAHAMFKPVRLTPAQEAALFTVLSTQNELKCTTLGSKEAIDFFAPLEAMGLVDVWRAPNTKPRVMITPKGIQAIGAE